MNEEVYQRLEDYRLNKRWDEGILSLTEELRNDPSNSEIAAYLTEMAYKSGRIEEAVIYGMHYRELTPADSKENIRYKSEITQLDVYGFLMNAFIKMKDYKSANEILWEVYNAIGGLTPVMVNVAIVLEAVLRGKEQALTLASQYKDSYMNFPDAEEYNREIEEALKKIEDLNPAVTGEGLSEKWKNVKDRIWKDPDEAEDILSLMISWETERYIKKNPDKEGLDAFKALRDINSGAGGEGAELFRTNYGGNYTEVLKDVEKYIDPDKAEAGEKLILAYISGTRSNLSGDKGFRDKAEKLLKDYAAKESGKEQSGPDIYPIMWYYLASFVDYSDAQQDVKTTDITPIEEKPAETIIVEDIPIKEAPKKVEKEPEKVEEAPVKVKEEKPLDIRSSFIISEDENIVWVDNEEHTSVVLTDRWIYIKPSGMDIQAVKPEKIIAYQMSSDGVTLYTDGFEFGISVLSSRTKQSDFIRLIKPIIESTNK
ncbi:MAG: hypothetical protein IJ065_06500 [Eubacterium sp.]|nr:hypothetical protein [Eubacterium sp.]